MSRTLFRIASASLLALSLTVAAGCASNSGASSAMPPGGYDTAAPAHPAAMSVPGVQRTATAVDGINSLSQELGSTRATIDETLASLAELSNAQGDLLVPFQRFIDLRTRVDDGAQRLGERGEDMRTRARDYITNWEVEVYGVEDPSLRQQAETRRSQVRDDYGRIADGTRALREAMEPFRGQLKDLETFLANDLTANGVRAAAPSVQKADQSGRQVQQRIDALVGQLNRVAATMAPAVSPAAPPASPGAGTTSAPPPAPRGAGSVADPNK